MKAMPATRRAARRAPRPRARPTPIVITPRGRTVLVVGVVIVLALFFYAASSTLVLLIGGFLFAMILSFPVNWLSRCLPRGVAILVTVLIVLVLVAVGLFIAVPLLFAQLTDLARAIPGFAAASGERVQSWIDTLESRGLLPADTDTVIARVEAALFARGQQVVESFLGNLVAALFGSVVPTVILTSTTLVVALYLVADVRRVKASYLRLAPRRYRRDAAELWEMLASTFRRWLGAQLISMIYEGVAAWLGLLALGIPFAPLLAIWMALTAFIPYIGAWLGAIPAMLVALVESPVKALAVGGLYFLINVTDGNLLCPRLQGKAVGASPVLVIVAVIGGGQIFGLLGAFLAVPALAFLKVLIDFLRVRLQVRPASLAIALAGPLPAERPNGTDGGPPDR